ncbi:MAG: RHS repeat-associated core domain-containing protein, partial [Candidatus Hydrogenedentes bacterium]|nr:RHS repeat-associated core domain-containing protein [Candidatus Hydrogenedentota bacterium]
DTSPISGPWGQVRFRHADSNNFGYLTLYPGSFSLSEKRAGTLVTLASGSWSTTSGDWYDVTLIADGSHIELWRGPKGGAQTRMCSVDTATVLSGAASYLVVTTDGVYAFDDVQVSAEDLSATTYTYDAANQLTAMNVNGTTTNFTYDDWGRMVGKTQGSYAATYSYRFGDKLKAATSNFPGETASVGYNYDGLGRRRLEQRDNTTATWFRWSGSEECGEYAGTVGSWTIGALQTGYVPGLATFAGSNPAAAEWRYHLTDHLGSVRQLTGQTKAALARYDYAPYGELLRSAGLPLTIGYTGHLWDSAISQYYAPFRYYNPQTARWNMRDPLGFVDGPNVYAYVAGNPVNSIDPFGLVRNLCRPGPKAPIDWPKPRRWTWNPNRGWYEKNNEHAVWHPPGKPRDGGDDDSSKPYGHGKGHWDITDRHGRTRRQNNLDRSMLDQIKDGIVIIGDWINNNLPVPSHRPVPGAPMPMPSTQIPWFQDSSCQK